MVILGFSGIPNGEFYYRNHLRKMTTKSDLCLAGGVFLNSVANGKIRRSGLFDRVHIPPVPGDHGGALGAAFWAYASHDGIDKVGDTEFSAFCGPGFTEPDIEAALHEYSADIVFTRSTSVAEDAADLLVRGQILGWFQGRMEYGPRALGHRSILASPLLAGMKEVVNERIKHREPYRPFAGAVPEEEASTFFEIA
jgi:carbamoyltransferase